MDTINQILKKEELSKEDIVTLLKITNKETLNKLGEYAAEIKAEQVDKKVYYRGLVEFSNICDKNCLYCGIRKGNTKVEKYKLPENEVLMAAKYAFDNGYASMVLQSGELDSEDFINEVDALLKKIKTMSDGKLGITLSCGEQTEETYRRWFESGAHRYLLRIETSNKDLYYKIHPRNEKHNFEKRLDALKSLKRVGYQVGTGVMVGLPFQTIEDMADDLLFMKNFDIDMCGMGPYIEHEDTPLYQYKDRLLPRKERFYLTLKMIAILRITMKDINIAAATALQAIDPVGREKALKVGANVIMPNLTPTVYREGYQLYDNKPCMDEDVSECKNCLEARIYLSGDKIGYHEWGDSKHFEKRTKKTGTF